MRQMKIIAKNKRAYHDYEISDTFEAGIVLAGHEVKSVRAGHVSLKGSFISIRAGEAYLTNAHISLYSLAANIKSYDPVQSRKILLHRREINKIIGLTDAQGKSVVPLAIGLVRGLVKLQIGVGRGKKLYDKREVQKKRQMLRDADREIKPVK